MTAGTVSLRRPVDPGIVLARLAAGPAEGWVSLAAVVAMVTALAWSIDDAAWVRGIGSLTDFLAPVGIAGIAAGLLGAKAGWGRWRTHVVGAAFAALIVPIVAGGVILGDAAPGWADIAAAGDRFRASADVAYKVYVDLAIDGRPFTSQYAHFLVIFGGIVWGTGQFAAYTVFGHRKPLDSVIVVGLALLGNMALTENGQLHLLVLFTVAALFLLIRSHAFEEQLVWVRRRIGDPEAMRGLYLRGGTVFVAGAVLGSLLLTATASSAPLQGLWTGLPQRFVDATEWFQRFMPGGGHLRPGGATSFGPNANIVGQWSSDDGVAFVAHLPANEQRHFYWRIASYADFEFTSWTWGRTEDLTRNQGSKLLAGTADDPSATAGRRQVTVTIETRDYRQDLVISPQSISSVDRPSTIHLAGTQGWFAGVEFRDVPSSYTVTALVPVLGDTVDGGLTENRLRAAGTDYPAEIRSLFLRQIPTGTVGPAAKQIEADIRELTPASDPYDVARTMRDYLRDPERFTYSTDVQSEMTAQCDGLSTVECFARIRTGYCQFYASTMAMLLRDMGIPARFVQGYLPGQRAKDGTETVMNSSAHAWVEVYFPGYGWVDFDPTGGGVAQDAPIPSGKPVVQTARPSTNGSGVPDDGKDPKNPRSFGNDPAGGGSITPNDRGNPGPFIAIGLILLVGVGAAAWAARRRAPRKPVHPDQAWRSLGSLARRVGFGPRPAQTVYEYASVLGDAVPSARPQLETVARAKVEVAYGRRDLGDERLRAIGDAYRSLRLAIVRLAFRRRLRGPRRPS